MQTPRVIASLAMWSHRHFRALFAVMLVPMAAGVLSHWFIGGRTAEIAGGLQAACLFVYFFFAAATILFGRYGPRTTKLLEWWPIAIARIVFFVLITAFTAYAVIFISVHLIQG